jgi:OOP family OmpA-OmpF porin
MKNYRFRLLTLALSLIASSPAIAQDSGITTTPENAASTPAPADSSAANTSTDTATTATADVFDNRFYVAPLGAYALSPNSRPNGNAFGGALALGKSVVPHLGVEILGEYLHYNGKEVPATASGLTCAANALITNPACSPSHNPSQSIYGGGLGANVYLSPSNYGLFVHADAEGGNRFVYDGGLGLDLPFAKHSVAVRAEALYHKEQSEKAEPLFLLGLRIPFGSLAAPVVPAEPAVAVVPAVEPPPPPPAPAPPPCQTPAPGDTINLEGCKTGDTIVLRGVNFDFNKATLTLNAKTILDQVVTALTSRPDIKVEVDGHTDGKGSGPYNLKLSDRRAKSVKQYLVEKGIDAGRMTTKGFGKTMPIADNSTDEGRELNRRVELKVTEANGPVGAAGSTDVPVSSGASDSTAAPSPSTGTAAADASTPPQ